MTDETTLKPCPFCGGEAHYREWNGDECDIEVDHRDDCWMIEYEGFTDIRINEREKLIDAWNRRYMEDDLK